MNNKTNYEFLLSDLSTLKGVGSKTMNLLKKKRINNIFDLLWKLPKSYTDRSLSFKVKDLRIGENQTVTVTPKKYLFPRIRNLPNRVLCSDETGELDCVFFNSYEGYIRKILPLGKQITISGKISNFRNKYFFGTIVTVLFSPILKSLTFTDKLLSVYDLGNFHNKSKILFIFFFLNKLAVLAPTPLNEDKSCSRYL